MKNETVGDFISRDEAIEALNRRRPKTRGARPKSEALRLADVIVNQMMDAAVIAIENVPASALRAAQPTREGIDAEIGDIMVATRVRGGTPESRIYFALGSLRDALLDSLADKGE